MLVVVVGVTAHQGERESRLQGEGAQVLEIYNDGEVREMRDAATVLTIIREDPLQRTLDTAITISTGEPDATEIGHVRCAP